MTEISSFVIDNGCCFFVFISTDLQIAVDMNFYLIGIASERSAPENAKITIDDLNIGVSQIICISVQEAVISVLYSLAADSVAGQDRCLHSVFCHEQMATAFHDTM